MGRKKKKKKTTTRQRTSRTKTSRPPKKKGGFNNPGLEGKTVAAFRVWYTGGSSFGSSDLKDWKKAPRENVRAVVVYCSECMPGTTEPFRVIMNDQAYYWPWGAGKKPPKKVHVLEGGGEYNPVIREAALAAVRFEE